MYAYSDESQLTLCPAVSPSVGWRAGAYATLTSASIVADVITTDLLSCTCVCVCVCCVLSVFVGVHVSGCANVCVESGRRSTECRHIAVRRHSRPSNVTLVLYLVHSRVQHSHEGIHSTRSCRTTPVGTLLHFDTSGYLDTCEHTGIHKQ